MTLALTEVEIKGLDPGAALRDRVSTRMRAALEPLHVKPVAAQAMFFDDNGPKGGGVRCALMVRLPYRPTVRLEATARTARLAFDSVLPVLERQLERYRERDRDSRRRPKKYFIARRLSEGAVTTRRRAR